MNKEMNKENTITPLEDKFVFAQNVAGALQTAISTRKNLVLFGAAGHGKSEMTETALAPFNPYVLACGEGLTEEKLFGGLNMSVFRDTGQMVYNVEDSFMSHEVAVFEEMFDAPITTLLSVRDILTSRRFRQGAQNVPIKTKTVVVCTNRTPQEVAQDASSNALMERFPLQIEVKWDSYTKEDFQALYNVRFQPDEAEMLNLLADGISQMHSEGVRVSPRTAIHAAEVLLSTSAKNLQYVGELDPRITNWLVGKYAREEKNLQAIAQIRAAQAELDAICEAIANSSQAMIDTAEHTRNLNALMNSVIDLRVSDSVYQSYQTLITRIEETLASPDLQQSDANNELLAMLAQLHAKKRSAKGGRK